MERRSKFHKVSTVANPCLVSLENMILLGIIYTLIDNDPWMSEHFSNLFPAGNGETLLKMIGMAVKKKQNTYWSIKL